jgi:hypothetical protein
MSAFIPRFSVLSLVLALMTGCGGSSGGNSGGSGGGGNPTTVTSKFSGGTPTVVAAKIGSGAFTAETLSSGTLSLSIPSGTTDFAVAYVCPFFLTRPFQLPEEVVYEVSTADGTAFTGPCLTDLSTGQQGILTGNVDASGIPGASSVGIAVVNGSYNILAGATLNGGFSMTVPAGNDRVEVLVNNSALQGSGGIGLVAARNFNNQVVPGALNSGNTVVLGAADETTLAPITYSNVPSGYSVPTTSVGFIMGGNSGFGIAGPSTSQYPVLPAGAIQSGDFYEFAATAQSRTNSSEQVIVQTTSTNGGPVSFAFPAPWSYAGPTPAALPTFDFAYTGFSGKTGVIESVFASWISGNTGENLYEIAATANYQNGSTTLAFPNLSNLAGFLPSPSSGTQVTWTAEIVQASSGVFQAPASNTTGSAAVNSGTYVVP